MHKRTLVLWLGFIIGTPAMMVACSDDTSSGGTGGSDAGADTGVKDGSAGMGGNRSDSGSPEAATGGSTGTGGTVADSGTDGAVADSRTDGTVADGGTGGTVADGGTGGTVADGGTGGTVADGGTDGAVSDGGGADAQPDAVADAQSDGAPSVCATGCVAAASALTSPDGSDQSSTFTLAFPSNTTDLTNATVTFSLCVHAGSAGTLRVFVQGSNWAQFNGSSGLQTDLAALSCATGMHPISYAIESSDSGFAANSVMRWGIELRTAGPGTYTTPTIVYIDSVSFSNLPGDSGATVGPYDFAPLSDGGSNLQGFNADTSQWSNPIGEVSWVGP